MGRGNDGSLLGCLGMIIFVAGVALTFTGVGAIAGVPMVVICLIGARLIDGR